MGCCFSYTDTTKRGPSHPKPPSRHHHHSPPPPHKPNVTATRTPPPLEEETVKEVLSETPIIVKTQKTTLVSTTAAATTTQPQEPKILTQKNNKKHQEDQEISQASEICNNVNDTLSTATTTTAATTTTITDIREDEVTSKKRVNKSPAKVRKKRPHTGDRERVPKPPAKTTGQVIIRTAAGQRNVGSSGVRRDFGRSPGTRTAGGVGRGRVGASPGKVTAEAGGRSVERKKEETVNGTVLMQQRQEGNESLENPLVSLEGFIFL
ncbi:PREDICTED: uncharacterized protein LOC105126473 [Populus euphratica]|uniref:Uncharacterized protein LOC105126473 n=1 Tax=Populus euphratica TaxID=75702 RepID=A0AAJ6UA62_POPEU|nr:PREDICTED: uncharacterized protein LOC105126473 [Populus euphratica]